MSRCKFPTGVLVALLLGLIASVVTAAPQDANYEVGASAGFWLSGTIDADGAELDKDSSFLLRAFADMYVTPKFAIGAYVNYGPAEVEGVDGSFAEIGMGIKPRFFISPEISIKPGLNIGYRSLSSDSEYGDDVDGLAVNLSIEGQYHLANSPVIPFLDIGFLSQPTGGNDYADITWAPIMYLSFGAAYGF
ncbi:outer membrane beta-barrel protein [Marispirochaeta aestuarii]|uniref:outer membrane beta-barrel protein n=1 Tax=Marispirochaeta aestuarii TaxID=1963862 RepID=UPI0029C78CB8|nr:outer membrane beta-barrel protein [Marispirochaeta aestuarii]